MEVIPFTEWTVHGKWGPAFKFRAKPEALVLHHSVTNLDRRDPTVQAQHVERIIKNRRGFGMVAYNYLIPSDGSCIFEGRGLRYGNGANNAKANGKKLGLSNRNTVSVCLYGNFDGDPQNGEDLTAQLQAVVDLLGYLRGKGHDIEKIVGHRDVSATACPGKRAYQALPSLRAAWRAGDRTLTAKAPKTVPAPATPSSVVNLPAKFVSVTRGQVMVLQKVAGCTADGIYGPKTHKALSEELGLL